MGCIYIIENNINFGVYVGATNNPTNRWKQHRYYLKNNSHHSTYLQRSWSKYGEHAFSFIIVELVDDEELIAKEQFWINYYLDSGRKVYNMSKTAGRVTGYKWSDEQRNKISQSRIGRKFTKEQRKNVSDGHAALNEPVDLISPTGILYTSVRNIREFCRTHQLVSTALSKVVDRKLKQHKGWCRADTPYVPRCFAFVSPSGEIYENIERCDVFCEEHGLSRKNMSAVHTGHKKSHKGWTKYDANG